MSDCHVEKEQIPAEDHCHQPARRDWLLWISLLIVGPAYITHFFMAGDHESWLGRFVATCYEMINLMWIGIFIGAILMGFLARIPRAFIMSMLGTKKGLNGIVRATIAGVLFDVCSHGIMMIGAKLYERGATLGQVMAFLIASPWNSISLTIILFTLIGVKWTLVFTLLSVVIGIASGLLFDLLVDKGVLPENHNMVNVEPVNEDFDFWRDAKAGIKMVTWTPRYILDTFKQGFAESVTLVRWLLLGVIITAAMRVVLTPDSLYESLFGPTLTGLFVTLFAATIIEVCSEGTVPIAGDIYRRTGAVGNTFTFLMTGVSTNITTLMILREATKSWKAALYLPLITVPQILIFAYILNMAGL